jgi:hypothetical protein
MDNQLYKNLESKEKFLPLLELFVSRSIEEQYADSIQETSPITYAMFYERFSRIISTRNAEYVFSYCHSPIERIFLNSLSLLFVKNHFTCLHFTPPSKDVEADIGQKRKVYGSIMCLIESYKEQTGDLEMIHFDKALEQKKAEESLTQEEVEEIKMHHSIIQHFEWNSIHITPQAGFPNLKINDKSIRVDIYLWVPGNPDIKIVVECDGYQYHSDKHTFENDRARDRLLQLNGYRIIRFSGTEINRNPVKVSNELFDLLEKIINEGNSPILF